jgi:hypothetical protein
MRLEMAVRRPEGDEPAGEDCDLGTVKELEDAYPWLIRFEDGRLRRVPDPRYKGPSVERPGDELDW